MKTDNKVPLSDRASPSLLSETEKVAIGALALETTNPAAISDLTGVDARWIPTLLGYLDDVDWDVPSAIERVGLNHADNGIYNREAYPILSKIGVIQ